jgi:hypothetical protein
MKAALEELGIGGLDFDGFGVFPIISLKDTVFASSDGAVNLGSEFFFYWRGSRPKYLVKTTGIADNDPRSAFVYSYDKVNDVKGQPISQTTDMWARNGVGFEIKVYTEVNALLDDERMVLLSIPYTSIRSISGVLANLLARGLDVTNTLLRAAPGPRITPKNPGSKPYYPWTVAQAE